MMAMPTSSISREAWPESLGRKRTSATGPAPRFGFRGPARRERVDWRLLAAIDPDAVQRDGDIDALQAILENLTFADVQGEGARTIADANLVKLARLAQLCLEYLLHCQDALEQQNATAVGDAAKWRQEVEATRAEAKTLNKRLSQMKKALRSYEHLSVSRKEAGLDSHDPVDIFKCHDGKLFVTEKHARAHIQKRYPAHECEALYELIVRVPAAMRTDAGGSVKATNTVKAIQEAKAEEESKRKQHLALEQRVSDLAAANKTLAEQLDAASVALRNAQHLAFVAESRADQLDKDKSQLWSSLESARHELELKAQQMEASEQLRAAESKRLLDLAQEQDKTMRAQLERERAEYMSSIKSLLANTSTFAGRLGERSRAGFMEDDESSADDDCSKVSRRPSKRSSFTSRTELLLEQLVKMSQMVEPEPSPDTSPAPRKETVRGESAQVTSNKLVKESVEVGNLRRALEDQRQAFDDLEHSVVRDKQLARDQLQRVQLQHQSEVGELEQEHAAQLLRKDAALSKAQHQAASAKQQAEDAQSELQQALQEAIALRKQLAKLRSDEKDSAAQVHKEMIQDLEMEKADLEAQVQQLRGGAKLLTRQVADLETALEAANKDAAHAQGEVERYKLLVQENKTKVRTAEGDLEDAQHEAQQAQRSVQRMQQDLDLVKSDLGHARTANEKLRLDCERLRAECARLQDDADAARARAAAAEGSEGDLVQRLKKELHECQQKLDEAQTSQIEARGGTGASDPHRSQSLVHLMPSRDDTLPAPATLEYGAAKQEHVGASKVKEVRRLHGDVDDDILEIPDMQDVAEQPTGTASTLKLEEHSAEASGAKDPAEEEVGSEDTEAEEKHAQEVREKLDVEQERERANAKEKRDKTEVEVAAAEAKRRQEQETAARTLAEQGNASSASAASQRMASMAQDGGDGQEDACDEATQMASRAESKPVQDEAARQKRLAALRGMASGRRGTVKQEEEEMDELETIQVDEPTVPSHPRRPAAAAVAATSSLAPRSDALRSNEPQSGLGDAQGGCVETFVVLDDSDKSDKERTERERSASEVEEVKEFVLTEDGTSAATPRPSLDGTQKNILPEDAETGILEEQDIQDSEAKAGANGKDSRKSSSQDPNNPAVAGTLKYNDSDLSVSEDSGSDIEIGSLDLTGVVAAGKQRATEAAEEAAAAAKADVEESKQQHKAQAKREEDKGKLVVAGAGAGGGESAHKDTEVQAPDDKDKDQGKCDDKLQGTHKEQPLDKSSDQDAGASVSDKVEVEHMGADTKTQRRSKLEAEQASKHELLAKGRMTPDPNAPRLMDPSELTESEVEEVEEEEEEESEEEDQISLSSSKTAPQKKAAITAELTKGQTAEPVIREIESKEAGAEAKEEPSFLRQELVLAKYDADKQEFVGRFTHTLASVKKEMMTTQHHVRSYLNSTLYTKHEDSKDLGVRPLPPAALTKSLSLVQADLLGASISGGKVDKAQLESMLKVRSQVEGMVERMLAEFNAEKAAKQAEEERTKQGDACKAEQLVPANTQQAHAQETTQAEGDQHKHTAAAASAAAPPTQAAHLEPSSPSDVRGGQGKADTTEEADARDKDSVKGEEGPNDKGAERHSSIKTSVSGVSVAASSAASSSSMDLSDLLRDDSSHHHKTSSAASSAPSRPMQDSDDLDDWDDIELPSPKIQLSADKDDGSEPPSLPDSMQSTPKSAKTGSLLDRIAHPSQALALGGQSAKDLKGLDKLLTAKKQAGREEQEADESSDWDLSSHGSPLPSGRGGKPSLSPHLSFGASKAAKTAASSSSSTKLPPAIDIKATPSSSLASAGAAKQQAELEQSNKQQAQQQHQRGLVPQAETDEPVSDSWDTPTPTPLKGNAGDDVAEESDWDAESPAVSFTGAGKRVATGAAGSVLQGQSGQGEEEVGNASASFDWDDSPAPAKQQHHHKEEEGGGEEEADVLMRQEMMRHEVTSDGQEEEEEEEEEEEHDMDAIAELLDGGGGRKPGEDPKESEKKKSGYGGGITAELVSSVKSNLRKTGIDVTTPTSSGETPLAKPLGGIKWALSAAAADKSPDDSLDVEFL